VLLEELPLLLVRRLEAAIGKTGHDLAQRRSIIFRLRIVLRALDAERSEIAAQPRQRPLVQEAGQVVGGIRQDLAAPDSDEQVEIFALDRRCGDILCGFGERGVGAPERRVVAFELGKCAEQLL
jgi:hypothetical protein